MSGSAAAVLHQILSWIVVVDGFLISQKPKVTAATLLAAS